MKKLQFRNYNFEFNKNDKKLVLNICKTVIKQTEGDQKYFAEVKALSSILEKIKSGDGTIKLTKDEFTRFRFQLEVNIKHFKDQIKKGWFFKKWLYKSILMQYEILYENHFKD